MLFYATPILYSSDLFPENMRWIHTINPMAGLINAYRDIFFNKVAPNLKIITIIGVISIVILIFGYKIFNKLEKGFAEEV